jgi:putative transposase
MANGIRQSKIIEEELNRLFSPEWLRKTSKETGFVKRDRKIDPVLMFWSLALGFGVQLQRTLASLRRLSHEKLIFTTSTVDSLCHHNNKISKTIIS